ncbi:MAG: type II toxin-antitoxin system HicB family antitoxin [Chloroflexi bacterium]|nr:type II toxin-antitoxin system HicB family antitoxin [Chloroflexota bacterium]
MVSVNVGKRRYTVVLTPDSEGGYMVTVPVLPGCFSQGATVEEAIEHAREAIECHIAGLEADGEPVPEERERPMAVLVEV